MTNERMKERRFSVALGFVGGLMFGILIGGFAL